MWLEKTARDAYQAERAASLGRLRSCLTLRSSVAARRDRSALVPAQGNDHADEASTSTNERGTDTTGWRADSLATSLAGPYPYRVDIRVSGFSV